MAAVGIHIVGVVGAGDVWVKVLEEGDIILAHLNAMPISPRLYVLRWRFSKGAPETPLSCAVQKTSTRG